MYEIGEGIAIGHLQNCGLGVVSSWFPIPAVPERCADRGLWTGFKLLISLVSARGFDPCYSNIRLSLVDPRLIFSLFDHFSADVVRSCRAVVPFMGALASQRFVPVLGVTRIFCSLGAAERWSLPAWPYSPSSAGGFS
jgi:hypothetical protein